MADDAAKHHGVSKFLSRDRWRSRSNADETRSTAVDQNVADFLKPSNSVRQRPVPPLAPRIDIAAAQKYTGNSSDLKSGNGTFTPSSLRGRGSQKKPRRPGLTVTFAVLEDIIGEGGDESEAPTMEISRRKHLLTTAGGVPQRISNDRHEEGRTQRSRTPPPTTRLQTADNKEFNPGYSNEVDSYDDVEATYRQLVGDDFGTAPPRKSKDSFRPQPLKRTATGFHARSESNDSVYSGQEESPEDSPAVSKQPPAQNPYQLPEINSVLDDSPLDFPNTSQVPYHNASELYSPKTQTKVHRMRQEEGRVMHQNARLSLIELAEEKVPAQVAAPPTAIPPSLTGAYRAWSPVDPPKSQFPGAAPVVPNHRAQPSQKLYQPPGYQSNAYQPVSYQAGSYQTPSPQLPTPTSLHSNPSPQAAQRAVSVRKPVPSSTNVNVAGALSQLQSGSARPAPAPLSIPNSRESNYAGTSEAHASMSARSQHSDSRIPATATSTKAPSSALSQAAVDDFAERCAHMRGIFRLQAEFEKPMQEYTPTQWLRAAAWWFIRGRSGMEAIIRGRPRSADGQTPGSQRGAEQRLTQPHVDLAKCWWILAEIIPVHHALPPSRDTSYQGRALAAATAKDNATAEYFGDCDVLNCCLKALLGSMTRNKVMPPYNALIQGQDQTIWVKYPSFASDLLPVLSGRKGRSLTESASAKVFPPLTVMAVTDTTQDFTYHRWFIKATLTTEDDQNERMSLLCLCSIMRARNDWNLKVVIATQKELLTICIMGDRTLGPSWEDVKWSEQDSALQIRLPHGYKLNVELEPADYRMLEALYKQAFTVQTGLFPLAEEHVVFEVGLQDFQYSDSMRPPAFPLERTRRCRVRLFGKTETRTEGAGQRRFFRGVRMLVLTSPKNKQLACVSHELGMKYPIIVEMATDTTSGQSYPAMQLYIKEEHRQCSMMMVFGQLKDRQMLYSALNEADACPDESQFAGVRLKKLSIEPTVETEAYSRAAQNPLGRMNWQEVVVLNKDPENPNHDFGQTVLSDNLRMVSQGAGGTVTDRINLGPGEFKLRLTPDGTPSIILLRHAQDDLTMAFDRHTAPFTTDQVEDLYRTIVSQSTKRTYTFYNPQDLHVFQKAITGFSVRFDDLAATFTISRRRPVTALSKHKKLEAALTRIQVVSHERDRITQLLVFFDDDFPYADSMGFVLKGVDVFERYEGKSAKGRFGVRIVDAKFSLPKTEKAKGSAIAQEDVERGFVCLDMPEYAGENDDIWIGFDVEEERERFLAALPAPATTMSRGMTLKAWKP